MVEAAQALGLSQPALTSHLKQFETFFTQDVFSYEGRKKILTPFGVLLRDLLQQKFGSLAFELKSVSEKFQSPEQVVLHVAGRSEILNFMAAKIVFPGTLIFNEADGASAVEGILQRRYDIAISNHLSKADQLHFKKLFSDQFYLVAPEKWLAGRRQISASLLTDLVERPYLSYKEEDANLKALLEHHQIQAQPAAHRVLSNWPNLILMAQMEMGWTLAPTRYAQEVKGLAAFAVPTSLIPETVFYALYRKESSSLPWLRSLLEELKKSCE